MELYTKTEVKQFLLEMAKRCRENMELPLNVYLENVSKNIDEITYLHPLEDDIPPTSQYFTTSSQTEISDEEIEKGAKEWYNKEGAYSASAIALKTWVYAIKWYREQLKTKQ